MLGGYAYSLDDLLVVGERIANIRQAFNVREGYNPLATPIPKRTYGLPPLEDGPTAGFTVEVETLCREYLEEMDWTHDDAVPSREKLIVLGLADVARDLW